MQLQLYALFKQATLGPNTTAKPGMLDFVVRVAGCVSGLFRWLNHCSA